MKMSMSHTIAMGDMFLDPEDYGYDSLFKNGVKEKQQSHFQFQESSSSYNTYVAYCATYCATITTSCLCIEVLKCTTKFKTDVEQVSVAL